MREQAVYAKHWPVSLWSKTHERFSATVCTRNSIQGAFRSFSLVAGKQPAFGASLRLIGQSFRVKELLFTNRKQKRCRAVATDNFFIMENQSQRPHAVVSKAPYI